MHDSAGMTQNKPSSLHIFKPGKHTAMSGVRLAFSESELQASAEAYDPKLHEAPLVVGHPKLDAPAYGWVSSLKFSDGDIDIDPGLYALPSQVNPDFADMVAAGAFKKISASFFSPSSPNNPVPGVYYLRHVGFLGAQAPAVKGLRTPSFASDEEGVVTFSEWDDVDNANLWRGLREWLIGKFGLEEADKVVPGYRVQSLEQGAQDELREAQAESAASMTGAPSFSEHQPQEISVTEQEAARLRAENAAQAQRIQEMQASATAQRHADIHAENLAFADQLIGQGRLLPAAREVIVATLDHFAKQEQPLEFGEGEVKAPLLDGLKKLFEAAPQQVDFSESATAQRASGQASDVVEFAAPSGFHVNQESLALHNKASAWMAQNNCDYVTAVAAIQKAQS